MWAGDLVIHLRTPWLGGDPTVLDFWMMKGGEQFVMTAREEEFPPGFELHPTEAKNQFARRMMRKLREGWKPGEIMTSPNIWRVQAGDRVTLMGNRPHTETGEFFGLFDFDTCALAYWLSPEGEMPFLEGALGVCPTNEGPQAEWMRTAFAKVRSRGVPGVFYTEWGLG